MKLKGTKNSFQLCASLRPVCHCSLRSISNQASLAKDEEYLRYSYTRHWFISPENGKAKVANENALHFFMMWTGGWH